MNRITGDDHWNTSGESTYVDDDGNYCFHTNILLPALTQDFTALEVTPYLHLEDGTETDLDFASFRVDYESYSFSMFFRKPAIAGFLF